MTNLELADSIRHNLFAKRDTVKEAWDFAFELINRMPYSEQMAATTALLVLTNTISEVIKQNENIG